MRLPWEISANKKHLNTKENRVSIILIGVAPYRVVQYNSSVMLFLKKMFNIKMIRLLRDTVSNYGRIDRVAHKLEAVQASYFLN